MREKWNLLVLLGFVLVYGCGSFKPQPTAYLGYEHRVFEKEKYRHKTHKDDGFLSGSPGSTAVSGGDFARLGMRTSSHTPLKNLGVYWDVGILVGGGRDSHKNDNDSRPTGHHSAVYSKVFPIAPELVVGTRYSLTDRLSVGGELNWAYFNVQHGWDRFDKDDKASSSSHFALSIGPTLGYEFDFMGVEAGFGFPLMDEKFMFELTFFYPGYREKKTE